jgi:RimJ/RimL family protein N-acetyltransferase
MNNYRFYSRVVDLDAGQNTPPSTLIEEYEECLWQPTSTKITPTGFPANPFLVWWLFHKLTIFTSRDYALYLIHKGGKIVHRACVFPKYFRFPFMDKQDLQIGDTWTSPDYRGQGLATHAINRILTLCNAPSRHFWYVVRETNAPSIRVVEKAGFSLVGRGTKIKRFGLAILGSYRIN